MNDFESSLNHLLVDTFNSILEYEEKSLLKISKTPVTISEVHLMEIVYQSENGVTVSEIAAALDIAPPTVTVAVKKLENKGLLTKNQCENDGRRTIITLTELGFRISRAHSLFHKRMVRNVSEEFNDSEKEVLLKAMKKLKHFFT